MRSKRFGPRRGMRIAGRKKNRLSPSNACALSMKAERGSILVAGLQGHLRSRTEMSAQFDAFAARGTHHGALCGDTPGEHRCGFTSACAGCAPRADRSQERTLRGLRRCALPSFWVHPFFLLRERERDRAKKRADGSESFGISVVWPCHSFTGYGGILPARCLTPKA